ncbi:hypothetical protein G3I40_09090 [Streptomyces sp. SID14478]|nr:hypothetical protein [Streptomyces sp. SID14478]NEB75380.1 hypothetical protein [Streptomyces sp. SID14478]
MSTPEPRFLPFDMYGTTGAPIRRGDVPGHLAGDGPDREVRQAEAA